MICRKSETLEDFKIRFVFHRIRQSEIFKLMWWRCESTSRCTDWGNAKLISIGQNPVFANFISLFWRTLFFQQRLMPTLIDTFFSVHVRHVNCRSTRSSGRTHPQIHNRNRTDPSCTLILSYRIQIRFTWSLVFKRQN